MKLRLPLQLNNSKRLLSIINEQNLLHFNSRETKSNSIKLMKTIKDLITEICCLVSEYSNKSFKWENNYSAN